MVRRKRLLFSLFLVICCLAGVGWYAWYQSHHFRHLYTVKTGVLYRSGQLTRKGLERVLYEKNIGTVINLRGSKRLTGKDWEEELCFKNFVSYVSIPLSTDEGISPGDTRPALDDAATRFLEIMSDPATYPKPVLIHCLSGKHETGVMVALYRMECQGWNKERAIEEMRRLGCADSSGYDPLRDYLLNWTLLKERRAVPVSARITR